MDKDDILIDYTNAMADTAGEGRGIGMAELEGLKERAGEIHAELQRGREAGDLAFYELPYQNVTRIIQMNSGRCREADNVVVLGIGGSALGARALAKALLPPFHELLDRKNRGNCPRLMVADNIDPDNFMGLLASLDLSRSVFIVISKSGGTAETMSQFLIVRDLLLKKFGEDGYRERMLAVTDQEKGYLRQIVDQDGLDWISLPAGVGGRFSVLTPVGLLPAAACGMDIVGLLKGAARMDKRTREADLFSNPAYLLASIYYLADTGLGRNVMVMMPYASSLLELAEWFQQLWAESLGKARRLDGSDAHTGSTPVRALGATDQHSQAQLYMEGPPDKLVTFLRLRSFREKGSIPEAFEDIEGVGYLGGHTLEELINAEQAATEAALAAAGRPNLRIELPRLDAYCLGQVMYLLEVATVFAGGLYRVNPLDQPGVEMGKRYAFAMMGRKGFEKEDRDLKTWKDRPRLLI